MNTTIGTGQVQKRLASNANTSWQNYYFTRFVSPALDMSSITSQTWTFNFAARENSNGSNSGLNANFPVGFGDDTTNICIYVWRPSTQARVGYVRDEYTVNELTEGASANTEYSHSITFPGSSVSGLQPGDRLVMEIWFTTRQANSVSYNDDFFYDGTTVTTATNQVVSNHASFIETPQTLVFEAGATTPVGNTSSHVYNIVGGTTSTLVGTSTMHRYKILPQAAPPPDQIKADGFTIFMRVFIPFLNNEALYNRRGVLVSKIDDEQVTHAYVAQISDKGDIYWIVKDDSREYTLTAPDAINIPFSGLPDFEETDFNSQDFFTLASINTLPNPILYSDLAFTYSFKDHKMQILNNGTILASTATNPENTGLIGWWRLSEGGDIGNTVTNPTSFARTVYNSVTTGSNGTISGTGSWTNEIDQHETYLKFDGINSLITIPTYAEIQSFTAFTISLWYRPKSIPEASTFHYLFNLDWQNDGSFIAYVNSNGAVVIEIRDDSAVKISASKTNAFPDLDEWYHICITWKSGEVANVFVNSVIAAGSTPLTGTLSTNASIAIGSTNTTSTPDGMIHDVKFWNRRLLSTEVETLFENGHPVSGFPPWNEDPPPPPENPVPITNPFTQIYHLAKPPTNLAWQKLHKLVVSGFTQVYSNADGVTVPERNEPFATVYNVTDTGSGGGSGGGSVETVYNQSVSSSGQHIEFEGGISRAGIRFNSGNPHLTKKVTKVTVQWRKQGSPGGSVSVGIRKATDGSFVSLGSFSPGSGGSGEQFTVINAPSNAYAMAANDIVSVEYPSGSNTIELTEIEDSANDVSGFTSVVNTSSVNSRTICMVIETTSGGGASGSEIKLDFQANSNKAVAVWLPNSNNTSLIGKKITRATFKLKRTGNPGGQVVCRIRPSSSGAGIVLQSRLATDIPEGTPADVTFTGTANGLPGGLALAAGYRVTIEPTAGNASAYISSYTTNPSQVTNCNEIRLFDPPENPPLVPQVNFSWQSYGSNDVVGKLETGGFIVPSKNAWFALDGGAVRAIGQRVINSSSPLNGKKITRFRPKLKAIGNPTGTIRCVIRTSAGTEVGNLGTREANEVDPNNFVEVEFTNILQPRTLTTGDQIMIEYIGTTSAHVQAMIEWDETHGGQLGNDQAVTFNGSSYTPIAADMSGTAFVGGSATDPTSRERVGIRVRTTTSSLYLKKLSKALIWIRKVGSPPGSVFMRIRRAADDSTVANIGSITTSSITGEQQKTFTSTPVSVYAIQLNDKVLIEYNDNSSSDTNYVEVAITSIDAIDSTNSTLVKYDALFTNYDEVTTNDLVMTAHQGGDTFTPTGDEIPPPPPPEYTHDLHIFAGGYPYDYYGEDDPDTTANWVSVICPDIRFYRKILTVQELINIYENRRDRANLPHGQVCVTGFFSLNP